MIHFHQFRKLFCLFFIVIALILPFKAVYAGTFTVTDIKVEASGESSAVARNDAMKEAEQKAFAVILERVARSEIPADFIEKNKDKISNLVSEMDVTSEKVTGKHYSGIINITFNNNMVSSFLEDSGIIYTEAKSKNTLVIPALYIDGQLVALDDNPFAQSLSALETSGSLVKLRVAPLSSLSSYDNDINKLLEELINGNMQFIPEELAQKYNADDILLASLRENQKAQSTASAASDTVEDVGDDKSDNQPAVLELNSLKGNSSTNQKFYLEPSETQTDYQVAANFILGNMESNWKTETEKSSNTTSNATTVYVPIDNLSNWSALRRKLGTINNVERFDIKELTSSYALIDLHFRGDFGSLVNSLNQNGLTIANGVNGSELISYEFFDDNNNN